MKQMKRIMLAAMLIIAIAVMSACHQNPSQEQLYGKLFSHFKEFGFDCTLQEMDSERSMPIYKADVWRSLYLDEEEVLLYFDESNRADYLAAFVDETVYGSVWQFGLRFLLVYAGENEAVLEALNAIPNG